MDTHLHELLQNQNIIYYQLNHNKKEPIFDDAIHGGNGGGARIETVNKAFGIEIADMEGRNTNKK